MNNYPFGDGSDGVLEAGSVVSLTRDAQYESIERGAAVRQDGYRIFVRGVSPLPIAIVDGVTHFGTLPETETQP